MKIVLIAIASLLVIANLAFAQDAAVERVQHGNLISEGIPEIPIELVERLSAYQNVSRSQFLDWSGESKILIAARIGETVQVHLVSEPEGPNLQQTFQNETVIAAISRPMHNQFVFQVDESGNERFQFYLHDLESESSTRITDPALMNEDPVFSPDGSLLIWTHPSDDEGNYTISIADPDHPESRRDIWDGTGIWWPLAISNDNQNALLIFYRNPNEGRLALLNIDSGEISPINPSDQEIAYRDAKFGPGNDVIFYTSNEDSDFFNLVRYDIASGSQVFLTESIGWDVDEFDVSPIDSRAAITINRDGRSEIQIIDTRSGERLLSPDLPSGIVDGIGFNSNGESIGFTLDAAISPTNAWSMNVITGALTQWTSSEGSDLDMSGFIDPEHVHFPSFDGLDIPAFVYRPADEGPHPVLIYIHGGPEAQFQPRYSSNFQFWATELGVAIIAPNIRGSSGYGSSYITLDNGYKREDAIRDIGSLLDWIEDEPNLRSDRVLVYGSSYGGYAALASLIQYNDRLAGGIDVSGISNFVTFLENTDGYRRNMRRAEYGDERDPEMRDFLNSIAPVNRSSNISKPLFIIQGARDPRVPISEAEQMLAAVKDNGGVTWYLLASDEGHVFRRRENQDFQFQAIALFIEHTLLLPNEN